MPYCLYIPSISFQIEIKMEKCYGVRQELNRQMDSNLCVLQWALLLVLCLCLQHLKMSSNFSIQFLLFNLHFGFWDAYNPYLHKMGKKVQHLFEENCQVQPYIKFFVGDDFFPFCCHYMILYIRVACRSNLNADFLLCSIFGV